MDDDKLPYGRYYTAKATAQCGLVGAGIGGTVRRVGKKLYFALILGSASFAWLFYSRLHAVPDTYELLDSVTSPNGQRVVDRVLRWQDAGDGEHQYPFVLFELRRLKEPAMSGKVFLVRGIFSLDADDEADDPGTIYVRWVDNERLLIASPQGRQDNGISPSYAAGLTIDYATYGTDPDHLHSDAPPTVVHEQLNFAFEKPSYGNTGCELHSVGKSGEDVRLHFNEQGMSFIVSEPLSNTVNHMTSLAVDSKWLKAGIPHLWYRSEHYESLTAGRWGMRFRLGAEYGGVDLSNQVLRLLEELRNGELAIKAGYFLDNTEFIYATAVPASDETLAAFKRCAML